MAITVIVTKSIDQHLNQTGEQIIIDDWVSIVESDPALTFRKESNLARLPDGQELLVPVLQPNRSLSSPGSICRSSDTAGANS